MLALSVPQTSFTARNRFVRSRLMPKTDVFDTRESIGEKSAARVPGVFQFLSKSGFARKVLYTFETA